jgi:hypothetical protein
VFQRTGLRPAGEHIFTIFVCRPLTAQAGLLQGRVCVAREGVTVYFEDLAPCTYHPGSLDAASWAVPLRAVGWLEHGHRFFVGVAPAMLVPRIGRLLGLMRDHFPHERFRGLHECSLCAAMGRRVAETSSSENLLIPGSKEIYAAPGGLGHYVSAHSYLPPPGFIEGIASCPDPGSREYLEALRQANAGLEPPIESKEVDLARSRAMFERSRAFREALGVPLVGATRAEVMRAAGLIWPELSFSDGSGSIELENVTITFDGQDRVIEVEARERPTER